MGCDDVRRVVYFFLDGSLSSNRKREFLEHLNDCPGCAERTQLHRRLRTFVRKRLTAYMAPARLKVRLTRSLRAFFLVE